MKEKLNHCLRNVTLRQLRALAAVVRERSLSSAAERLHVTAPAVSLQLKQLEDLIGLPLVERSAGGYRTTAAGEEILGAGLQMERALAECAGALDSLRDPTSGRAALGVISTAKYFAPRAVAAFKRQHPRIEIRLMVGNRGDMLRSLEDYTLDLAIMGRPPDAFAVDSAILGEHPHVIIAPPDSPYAHRTQLSLKDLAGEPFLLREESSGTRMLVEGLLAQSGTILSQAMEIGSNETIKQAVIAGLGIGLISSHTIAEEVRDRRLAILDVAGLPVVRQWHVVKRAEKRLLPAAQTLWAFLATSARDHLPRPFDKNQRSEPLQAAET